MLFFAVLTSLLPLQKKAANGGTSVLLLLITVALTLPLFAAMGFAAQALLDLKKRDTTPFLAPVLVSSGGENQYMPAGVWQVSCLAEAYRASSSGSEGCAWL